MTLLRRLRRLECELISGHDWAISTAGEGPFGQGYTYRVVIRTCLRCHLKQTGGELIVRDPDGFEHRISGGDPIRWH